MFSEISFSVFTQPRLFPPNHLVLSLNTTHTNSTKLTQTDRSLFQPLGANTARVAQWIRRRSPKPKIASSSLAVGKFLVKLQFVVEFRRYDLII